jgi:hypothetical protein
MEESYTQNHTRIADIRRILATQKKPECAPNGIISSSGTPLLAFHGIVVPPSFKNAFFQEKSSPKPLCPIHRHAMFGHLIDAIYSLSKWEFTVCANHIPMAELFLPLTSILSTEVAGRLGRVFFNHIYSVGWQFYHHLDSGHIDSGSLARGETPIFLQHEEHMNKPEEYITYVPCRGDPLRYLINLSRLFLKSHIHCAQSSKLLSCIKDYASRRI